VYFSAPYTQDLLATFISQLADLVLLLSPAGKLLSLQFFDASQDDKAWFVLVPGS